jgi:hypothetical protein
VTVEAAATTSEYTLAMLDPQTGADKSVNVAWDSALALRPVLTRMRPCGYWLGADQSDAVLRLRGLGVQVKRIDEPGELRGEAYTETAREFGARADVRGSIADGGGAGVDRRRRGQLLRRPRSAARASRDRRDRARHAEQLHHPPPDRQRRRDCARAAAAGAEAECRALMRL